MGFDTSLLNGIVYLKIDKHWCTLFADTSNTNKWPNWGNNLWHTPLCESNWWTCLWIFTLDRVSGFQWKVHSLQIARAFFWQEDTDDGAASRHWYCAQMMELLSKFKGLFGNYNWPGHASIHSFRKGSETFSQSGTTCPPSSVSSTAKRGVAACWPYFGFVLAAELSECCLGRILAGLDPNDARFGTFPPLL